MAISYFDDKAKKVVQTDKKGITKGPKPPPKVNPVSYLTGQFMQQQQPPSQAPQAVGYWDAKPPYEPTNQDYRDALPINQPNKLPGLNPVSYLTGQFMQPQPQQQAPRAVGYWEARPPDDPAAQEYWESFGLSNDQKQKRRSTPAKTPTLYPTWEEWGMRAWQSFFKRRSKPNYDISDTNDNPYGTGSGTGTGYGTGGGYGDRPDIKNWWQQLVYWRI